MPNAGLQALVYGAEQSEMAEHVRRICRSTTLPVIADADTGHGMDDTAR